MERRLAAILAADGRCPAGSLARSYESGPIMADAEGTEMGEHGLLAQNRLVFEALERV